MSRGQNRDRDVKLFTAEEVFVSSSMPADANLLDCFDEGLKKSLQKLDKYYKKICDDPESFEIHNKKKKKKKLQVSSNVPISTSNTSPKPKPKFQKKNTNARTRIIRQYDTKNTGHKTDARPLLPPVPTTSKIVHQKKDKLVHLINTEEAKVEVDPLTIYNLSESKITISEPQINFSNQDQDDYQEFDDNDNDDDDNFFNETCSQNDETLNDNKSYPELESVQNESQTENKSCQVCGEELSVDRVHYGVSCCEGCKQFFRRSQLQSLTTEYKCPNSEDCVINKHTRTDCKYCRFQKCLSVGMTLLEPVVRNKGDKNISENEKPSNSNPKKKSRISTKDESNICEQCGKYFYDSSNLKAHIKTIHENQYRVYACFAQDCLSTFKRRDSRNAHLIQKHPEMAKERNLNEIPLCSICGKNFGTRHNYNLHMKVHASELVSCHLCGKMIKDYKLKRHIDYVHEGKPKAKRKEKEKQIFSGDPTIKCESQLCNKMFYMKAQMLDHFRRSYHADGPNIKRKPPKTVNRSHPKPTPSNVKCPIVECATEMLSTSLKNHLECYHHDVNDSSYTFYCPADEGCPASTKSRKEINIHLRIDHEEYAIVNGLFEKAFKCDFPGCNKSYAYRHALNDHFVSHTNAEDLTCKICSKFVKSAAYLKHHMQAVHQEKQFECPVSGCGKKFAFGTRLKTHLRDEHSQFNNSQKLIKKKRQRL